MALSMDQARYLEGLGSTTTAGILGSILGPLVGGGADIYRTYADSKQSREELKQREREITLLAPIMAEQQKQEALRIAASVRQQQYASRAAASWGPILLGVVLIGGVALVGAAAARR